MRCLDLVAFKGEKISKNIKPHPVLKTGSWYHLGVLYKIAHEHPSPLNMGGPYPPPTGEKLFNPPLVKNLMVYQFRVGGLPEEYFSAGKERK